MYLKFGDAFIQNYLVYHVFDRATMAIEDKGRPFFWYLVVMRVSMRIWFVALLGALPFSVYAVFKKIKRPETLFILVWATVTFAFFSISTSKLVWYIVPIYPAVAIMAANFINEFIGVMLKKLKVNSYMPIKFMSVFAIVVFGLVYLFFNRGLVYTSDLTGAESNMLIAKQTIYGTKLKVYVDKIELPLILFYTDGPYEAVEFSGLAKQLKQKEPADTLIFITKESRFRKLSETYPGLNLVAGEKEWVLGSFPPTVPNRK